MSRAFYIFPSFAEPGEIERASAAQLHRALCAAATTAGDLPVIVLNRDNSTTSNLIRDAVDVPFRTATLEEIGTLPEAPANQTAGVWFDNAIDWTVSEFVELWLRRYRGIALPPLFGLLSDSVVSRAADPSLIAWQTAVNRARLEQFTHLWAQNGQVILNLGLTPNLARISYTSPLFCWDWKRGSVKPRNETFVPDDAPAPVWGLNWTGGFDTASGYDSFVRMVPALNRVAAARLKAYAARGEAIVGAPASFVAVIYNPELPDDLIIPAGTVHVREQFVTGPTPRGPMANTITVSTNLLAERDSTLLALAEAGYPVIAPDLGIYRENLFNINRYSSELLAGFHHELPDMMADRAADDIYDTILHLVQTHFFPVEVRTMPQTYLRQSSVLRRTQAPQLITDQLDQIIGWEDRPAW